MHRQTRNALAFSCALFLSFGLACSTQTENNADVQANASLQSNANVASSNPSSSTSGSSSSSSKIAPKDAVSAKAAALEIKAGGAADAMVSVIVAEGYHVNANPPTMAYLIPTKVEIEPQAGIAAGQPVYPPAVTKKFAFADKPLAVYEGEAKIKVALRAEAGAAKGATTLRAKVTAQPCDEQACYPPREIETTISVTVK